MVKVGLGADFGDITGGKSAQDTIGMLLTSLNDDVPGMNGKEIRMK